MEETIRKVIKLESEVNYLQERMRDVEAKNRELEGLVQLQMTSHTQINNMLKQIHSTLLKEDEYGQPGLMARITTIEKWVNVMDKQKAWIMGGLVVAMAVGRLLSVIVEEIYKVMK